MAKLIRYFKKKAYHIILYSMLFTICYADDKAMQGWYYYQKESPVVELHPIYKSYSEFNTALKQEFAEIEYKAIYNPTPDNIKAYNQALKTVSNNAIRFGLLSVTENWQDPSSGNSAANGAGLQLDLDKQRQQIAKIVKRYAIFYFISKDCKYCSVEANELKRLEYTYNINIQVVSLDGSTLLQYPSPILDHGISHKLNIQAPGELLAFDSNTNQTTVLGFGYIHFDQLIQHLQTLFITGTANWQQYLEQKQPVSLTQDTL